MKVRLSGVEEKEVFGSGGRKKIGKHILTTQQQKRYELLS